jgi:peptidoglycan/LPS O-acetylase OafA/YrhL
LNVLLNHVYLKLGIGLADENNTVHLAHPKYRPDIDGLRAVAVLSVVFFHAFPTWFTGGFVGVDIFFVISGFLISTILFNSLNNDVFSFTEFYSRRILRIFPSLLVILLACLVAGWFTLLSDEYKQLGKHIAGGASFISNYILSSESGYFNNSADTKPLLHLWSLGIEEQFYIIWPVLLWMGCKRKINFLFVTVTIASISFALNIRGINSDIVSTFYSPQTRFWELLSGSLLAYTQLNSSQWPLKSRPIASALSAIGIILIGFAFLKLDKDSLFPGFWAILPTLGAVLTISAGKEAWLNRNILSKRILVWFGLISYPLYLWHWPVLSFLRIVRGQTPAVTIRLFAIAFSIFAAWLTYTCIEKPIRYGKKGKHKVFLLLLLMIAMGGLGYLPYYKDGFQSRMKASNDFLAYFNNDLPAMKYFEKLNLFKEWRAECAFFDTEKYRHGLLGGDVANSKPIPTLDKTCYVRDLKFEKAVLIWGDSHAQAIAPGIVRYIPKNWQVLQIASSGCATNPNIEEPSSSSQCNQSNYFAIKTIRESKPDVVVIAQNGGYELNNVQQTVEKLNNLGVKKVVFVGPTPHWTSDLPKILARKLNMVIPRKTHVGIDFDVFAKNDIMKKEIPTTERQTYVDIINLFCDSSGCLTYLGDDPKTGIITWDYGHLTPIASEYLAKNILIDKIVNGK